MAPATNEEQFKFLISCIRWSNNGKVDFGKVADECKIVSRGAAAKRYERMMKAHGISTNGSSGKSSSPTPRIRKDPNDDMATAKTKKRKVMDSFDDSMADDEEEEFSTPIKPEPGHTTGFEKELIRKEEDGGVERLAVVKGEYDEGMQAFQESRGGLMDYEQIMDEVNRTAIANSYSHPLQNPYGLAASAQSYTASPTGASDSKGYEVSSQSETSGDGTIIIP